MLSLPTCLSVQSSCAAQVVLACLLCLEGNKEKAWLDGLQCTNGTRDSLPMVIVECFGACILRVPRTTVCDD